VSGFVFRSTTPDTPPRRSQEYALSEAETEALVSPPLSPPRQRGSPVQSPSGIPSNDEARLRRALASAAATSFRPRTPDSPLPTEEQTAPPSFTPPGTPPLARSTPQDGSSSEAIPTIAITTPPRRLSSSTSILDFRTPSPPHDLTNLSVLPSSSEDEVETREADVTPMRVDEDNLANPNFTAMKTPRPPGGWAFTPVLSKHAHRETSPPPASSPELNPAEPLSSSSTYLSRASSEPEQHSKPEAPAPNGLLTPIPSLSRANSLPLRTPAPPGAWMSTPNQLLSQNSSVDQSQFGSVGRRKSILKVRFDVAESEASTAEIEVPLSAVRISAPDMLLNGYVPQAESTPPKKPSGSPQVDAIHDPVQARPVTPERSTTPVSRFNAPSPRSLRRSPSLKVVDAFGRERIDEHSKRDAAQDIANGPIDSKDAIYPSSSSPAETPQSSRTPNKSNIRIVDAMGREIEEEAAPLIELAEPSVDEGSSASVLHDEVPIGRTETLSQMRQTLREWADGLSDGDR
jgi:serine/arginine repetitive matrix protein 2